MHKRDRERKKKQKECLKLFCHWKVCSRSCADDINILVTLNFRSLIHFPGKDILGLGLNGSKERHKNYKSLTPSTAA
jgi:hypothetical protein